MIRRVVPHLALLAMIGALAAVSWQALRVLARPVPATAAKLATAERALAYRVRADAGPRFLLDGGRIQLKLSSLVVVADAATYDPRREVTYTLRMSIRHDDRELWRADVAITSRQSKADWDGRRWRREGAWGPGGKELADERLTIVDLPEVPVDAVLEIRTADGAEAMLRVFRADPRDAAERDRAALRADDAEKAEMVLSSTYVPWSMLEPDEQDRRLTRRWVRLAAIGEEGVDFTTRTVFLTDFRLSPARVDVAGLEVRRDRDIVVNVEGPTRIAIAPLGGARAPLRVEVVGATTAASAAAAGAQTIDLGPGANSVIVATESVDPVSVVIRGEPARWIVPGEQRAAMPAGTIGPDRVQIPITVIGPGATARLVVRDLGEGGFSGRMARVDARLVALAGDGSPAAANATVTATFVAADGSVVGADAVEVGGPPARFEQVPWPGGDGRVTEPVTFRVVAPAAAVAVLLTADRDVALRLYRWLPGPVEWSAPYARPLPPDVVWRYAPLARRAWYPMSADNHAELVRAGRIVDLDAQVRLQPFAAEDRWSAIDAGAASGTPRDRPVYRTIALRGSEQQRAREPVEADEADALVRDWVPGASTALAPGVARTLDFRAELTTRPRLSWAVPVDLIGSSAVVTVGSSSHAVKLETNVGSVALPRVAAGEHRVVITAPAGTDLWINRPPAGDRSGVHRDRTLHALGRAPVRFTVALAPRERVHLYAIVYARDGGVVPRVRMTVDGGRPSRRVGIASRLTRGEVVADLPAVTDVEARLLDLGGRSAGTPRVVHLGLLDDLVPGPHRIEIAKLAGSTTWIRVVATRTAIAPGGAGAGDGDDE